MFVCIPARQENGPKATKGVNVSLGILPMSGCRAEYRDAFVRELCYECVNVHAGKEMCLVWLLDVRNLMKQNSTCVTSFCIRLTDVCISAALSMSSSAKGKGAH